MSGVAPDASAWVVGLLLACAVLLSGRERTALPMGREGRGWRPAGSARPGSVGGGFAPGRRPSWLGGARRRERRRSASVALLCEALDLCVAGLRAGLSLSAVLQLVEREVDDAREVNGRVGHRRSGDVGGVATDGGATGGGAPGDVLALLRGQPGDWPSDPALGPAAAVISQARELSQSAGVPLADSWEAAAGLLREHEAVRRRVAVALAGPRATMRILILLPLAGPLVGAVFAVDPWRMYAGSPIAIGCLGLGLALLGIGRWWCSLLIRRLGLAAVT